MVCAVLFRLFGTVGWFNKLQTQKKVYIYIFTNTLKYEPQQLNLLSTKR